MWIGWLRRLRRARCYVESLNLCDLRGELGFLYLAECGFGQLFEEMPLSRIHVVSELDAQGLAYDRIHSP